MQVEDTLGGILEQRPGLLHQQPQLGLGVSRADMLDDPLPPLGVLSELNGRRPRGRPNLPDERHTATIGDPVSA